MTRQQQILLGGLTILLLGACTKEEPPKPAMLYPVVRAAMPGGYTLTAIQHPSEKDACTKTNERFATPLKANCPDCKIEASSCEASLSGAEKALMAGEPLPQYSVSAGSMRILLGGSDEVTKPVCEKMASDLAGKNPGTASCIPPVKRP